MIRPRWQKVLSDLWSNRIRSLLVVASIAVGLFAMGVMATIYAVSLEDMRRGYAEQYPANIHIDATYFNQAMVEHITEMDGVRAAQGTRKFGTRLEASPGEWIAVDMTAYKNPADLEINQLKLVEGSWPPSEGEIVFDRYRMDDTHAAVGDYVTLETPSGKNRQLKVIGVIHDQTIGAYGEPGGFFNAPVQGYIHRDSLESLGQAYPTYYSSLNLTVEGDSTDYSYLEKISASVRDELEKNDISIRSTALRSSYEHPNLYLARAILAVLVSIGLIVVILSGFLITNTLQAMMNQQVTQIGILKTVGGRRYQISGIYLMLNLVFGILAFAIALPLSFQVAFLAVDYLAIEMGTTFYGFRIVPEVIILEAAIALIMPQIAAILPILQGTRISVQEALSGISQSHPPERGWLDRRISRLRNFSMMIVISLRNTFRRKGRLLLTLITLTLGGAVFIATFNVRVSMMMYIQQIINYFLADVNITLEQPYRIDEIDRIMKEVPGVKQVEGWAFAQSELVLSDGSVGESVSLLAPPAASPLVEPILIEGRWIVPGDRSAITLSELFRDRFPELDVGDTIRLKVNGDETDWTIVGFYQLAGKVSGYAAYTSYEYLSELTHQEGKAIAYRVVASHNGMTRGEQEALGRAIEAHLETYGIQVIDVTSGQSLSELASDGFNVVIGFLLFLAVLTALVGSIGLTGSMSLNVMERTREIGVLRAIGASDKMLMRIVLLEGSLIGLLSWLLASAASFPISQLISDSMSQALFGGDTQFGVTYTGFVIWLGVVVVLSVLASVMPARSATHLTIREVLAYE